MSSSCLQGQVLFWGGLLLFILGSSLVGVGPVRGRRGGGRGGGVGQDRLGPSYFFIPLVIGPLNSLDFLSIVLIMILSAFDSTRETIRNSQDKGGCACVQHNNALAVYCEECLQISWTAASALSPRLRRGRVQCAGQYACCGPQRRHPENAR